MDSINSFVIEPVENGLDQQHVLRKKEWREQSGLATSSPRPGEVEHNKSKQHNSSEATKVAGGTRSVSVSVSVSVSDSERRPSDGSIVPRRVTKTHGERVRNRKKKTKLVLITWQTEAVHWEYANNQQSQQTQRPGPDNCLSYPFPCPFIGTGTRVLMNLL